MPVWRQSPVIIALAIGYPTVALFGAAIALRAAEGPQRTRWAIYLFMLATTVTATILVQRVGSTANVLAVPGATHLLMQGIRRARAQTRLLRRVGLSAVTIIAFAPPTPALAVASFTTTKQSAREKLSNAECALTSRFVALDALAPARMLTPLDIGPSVLLDTRHSIVATGHHRNHAAMADVIRAFTGNDATAHAIVARHGVRYVVLCQDTVELEVYAYYAPRGFAHMLNNGRPPAWLEPVRVPNVGLIRVWRVIG